MKFFNSLMNKTLIVFVVWISLFSLGYGFLYSTSINPISIVILAVLLALFIIFRNKVIAVLKLSNINKFNIKHILFIALIVRLVWVILIPNKPVSDFGLMYSYAKEAANGKYYGFYGIGYFARFAHDSITVLYFSLFYHITNNPLIIIKLLNVIFQTTAVYYMYKLVKEVFKSEEHAKFSAFLLALFPPFVVFVSQTMSENIAMPFYIGSVYYFFKAINREGKERIYNYMICGLALSAANMFRMVGVVVLVAYGMYLLLYEGYRIFLTKYPVILISFCLLFFLVSHSLVSLGVLENELWASKEPAITSVLKGTNMASHGGYNNEDAKLPIKLNYDSAAIKREAAKIIEKRLTTTPPLILVSFYAQKIAIQWGSSDYGAVSWTVSGDDNSFALALIKENMLIVNLYTTFFYLFILIRAIISLCKTKVGYNKEMHFFYILMFGFILFCLITEMQPRYGFVAAWIFIILGIRKTESNPPAMV